MIAGREAAQGSFKQNTPKCDLMAWDRKRQFDRDAYFRDNPIDCYSINNDMVKREKLHSAYGQLII